MCPQCAMKNFKKNVPLYFTGGDTMPLEMEIHVGIYAPSIFARKYGLKLNNILHLEKRIVLENRSVG